MCVVREKVVGCVVRSCDATTFPPKLSLSLDVAGKTEKIDGATAQAADQVILYCRGRKEEGRKMREENLFSQAVMTRS